MNQSNSNKQVLLSVIGVAILVVAVVGVSFAFFNYTRTGDQNTVQTGKINFVSTQSGTINLTNAFPLTTAQLTARQTAGTNSTDYSTITVDVRGNTTYAAGLDYRLTAQGVNMTATYTGADEQQHTALLPVTVLVTLDSTASSGVGTAANSENVDRYQTFNFGRVDGTTTNQLANDSVLASGHIAAASADGYADDRYHAVFKVTAYIDGSQIAITDTIQGDAIVVPNQTNGTTSRWINNRQVFTTAEWNSLNAASLTFSIRVESKEADGEYAYSPS